MVLGDALDADVAAQRVTAALAVLFVGLVGGVALDAVGVQAAQAVR